MAQVDGRDAGDVVGARRSMATLGGALRDLGMAVLLVLLAPVAVVAVGAPVVLFVRLLIEIGGRL